MGTLPTLFHGFLGLGEWNIPDNARIIPSGDDGGGVSVCMRTGSLALSAITGYSEMNYLVPTFCIVYCTRVYIRTV